MAVYVICSGFVAFSDQFICVCDHKCEGFKDGGSNHRRDWCAITAVLEHLGLVCCKSSFLCLSGEQKAETG